tara:strand:+ start:4270 stop:4419 length:150 start_codon:yes stop_codon:yes gene_type:complete
LKRIELIKNFINFCIEDAVNPSVKNIIEFNSAVEDFLNSKKKRSSNFEQ